MPRLILLILVGLAAWYVLRRLLDQVKPRVSVGAQGLALRVGRTIALLGWDEIKQIDLARMPTAGVDRFAVYLIGGRTVTVLDHYLGFAEFSAALFERWPQIQPEWTRVFDGPADISERVTVWRQEA